MKTRKRMVIMIVVVGVLLGLLVGFNVFKGIMIKKYMANAPVPTSTVTAMKAAYQSWAPSVSAVGTLRAVRGVDVSTEVVGIVQSLDFKSGEEVAAGHALAQLDASADLAQLRSLQAAADLAETVYTRDKAQLAAEVLSQQQVDTDLGELKSKRAQVDQQAAIVAKKTIRAPFAGRLGISTVNPGQYLNPGDKLVTLQTIDPIYVDFMLPQSRLPLVAVGRKVALTADGFPGVAFEGKVNAINSKVDPSTRNVQVEATVGNAKRLLLPGMFVTVALSAGEEQRYLTLPQTAVTYNPYGSTVFVVKDAGKKDAKGNAILEAQQVFVTTGPTRGDQVAILKGVDEGAQVVTSGQGKLKNGSPVAINNAVVPADNPHPTPQEQ